MVQFNVKRRGQKDKIRLALNQRIK